MPFKAAPSELPLFNTSFRKKLSYNIRNRVLTSLVRSMIPFGGDLMPQTQDYPHIDRRSDNAKSRLVFT